MANDTKTEATPITEATLIGSSIQELSKECRRNIQFREIQNSRKITPDMLGNAYIDRSVIGDARRVRLDIYVLPDPD